MRPLERRERTKLMHETANGRTSEQSNERTLIHPVAPFIFASSKPAYVHTVPMMGSMRLESDTVRSTNQSIPPAGTGQEADRGASAVHPQG